METFSLVLSILAITGSVFTYLYHDKKIKSQEARINEYELTKIENEKTEVLQAKVRANSIMTKPGLRTIKIYNAGRAIARNVQIEFNPRDFDDFIRLDNFPYPYLNPQDSTEFHIHMHTGMPNTMEIKMRWDDDKKAKNEHTQIITL